MLERLKKLFTYTNGVFLSGVMTGMVIDWVFISLSILAMVAWMLRNAARYVAKGTKRPSTGREVDK